MNVALRGPVTTAEFLAWEERQELRFELDGFRPVAMTGGTIAHDLITFVGRDSQGAVSSGVAAWAANREIVLLWTLWLRAMSRIGSPFCFRRRASCRWGGVSFGPTAKHHTARHGCA